MFGGCLIAKSHVRMRLILWGIVFLLSLSWSYAQEFPATEYKRVLIIHSYHQGLPWTDGQDKGIRQVLASYNDIQIHTEYLDSKRVPLEDISETVIHLFTRKYAGTQFDVIIVTDNNALNFVAKNYNTLFPGSAVVFCGINHFHPAMLEGLGRSVTGVVQSIDPVGTIKLIETLQPQLQKLVMVSGVTTTAQAIRKEVKEALTKDFPNQSVLWLDSLSTEELISRLGGLSRNDAVLLCNFNRDAEDRYYSHEESGRIISQASAAPVYAMGDQYLGTGITGGYMVSSIEQGITAAKLCLQILQTGRVPEIVTKSPNAVMFDYKIMARYSLDPSLLPASATIINQPVSFYKLHKTLIWNTILVFCLLIMALCGVSFGLMRTRQAERRVRQSEENLRITLHSIGDAVIALDTLARIIHMNPVAEQLTGWKYEEAKGKPFVDVFHMINAKTRQTADNPVFRVLKTGKIDAISNDTKLISKKGLEYHIADSAAPIKDANGQVSGVVLVLRNVTEEYRSQQALRNSEEQFRGLVESSYDWIWEVDANGAYTYASPQVEMILGYKPEEVIGKSCFDLMLPQEAMRIAPIFEKIIESRQPIELLENINLHKDGRHVILETSGVPFYDEDGNLAGYRGIDRDITEKKQAEHEREELVKTLEFKNKELQDIVYTASHDLRSPLVNIQGFSSELKYDCDHLLQLLGDENKEPNKKDQIESLAKADIPESLNFISNSAGRMARLLDGLLQVSRIGTNILNIEPVVVNQVAGEALATMEYQIKANDIDVTIDALPNCLADKQMLFRVFTNLLNNAEKYRDPSRKPEIQISGKVEDGRAIYCIIDNGIGIKPEHQEKVFEIFHRLHPDDETEGEGLGLTIVARILDRMDSRIWLHSEFGKGSQFYFSLPATSDESVDISKASSVF